LTPVRFLRSAQADIRAEKTFYRKISPELAIRLQTAVQAAVQGIAFQPLAMQVVDFNQDGKSPGSAGGLRQFDISGIR
jgi:hypothetical protein